MTKLEQFAKETMGIEMSEYQVKIARSMVTDRIFAKRQKYNLTETRRIVMAYMADSVKEVK